MPKCVTCGGDFVKQSWNQIVCSYRCYKPIARKRGKEFYRKKIKPAIEFYRDHILNEAIKDVKK